MAEVRPVNIPEDHKLSGGCTISLTELRSLQLLYAELVELLRAAVGLSAIVFLRDKPTVVEPLEVLTAGWQLSVSAAHRSEGRPVKAIASEPNPV
jgi:hypothetical protein